VRVLWRAEVGLEVVVQRVHGGRSIFLLVASECTQRSRHHLSTSQVRISDSHTVGVGTGGRTRKKDYLIERKMIVLCVLNTKENYLSCDHCGSREPLTVTKPHRLLLS
jgi:hypothetical protein